MPALEPSSSSARELIPLLIFGCLFVSYFGEELSYADLPCWRALASGLAAVMLARRISSPRELWLPIIALLLAWPWEHQLSTHLDPTLQLLTAWWAAPITEWTGLPVNLEGGIDPVLAIEGVRVHVTAQCAGLEPILATSSLGLIFAALATSNNRQRALLALGIPVLAHLVNVVRIVLSVHAANLWIDQEGTWDIAHDIIGYLCFGLFYLALFALAHTLRPTTPSSKSPAT